MLELKLRRTGKALSLWRRSRIGEVQQQQLNTALELIQLLDDLAQDFRALTPMETELRAGLKSRSLGLAVLKRIKLKQQARVSWLCAGVRSKKKEKKAARRGRKLAFFHARANARHVRNTIHALSGPDGAVHTSQSAMLDLLHDHFERLIGSQVAVSATFSWQELGLSRINLDERDQPITMEELHQAILDMLSVKAPGPGGFSMGFFKSAWLIVKDDLFLAFERLFSLKCRSLGQVNKSLIVLIPKKNDTVSVADYRPISLMHCSMKIFSKLLARRLADIYLPAG